MRSILLIDHGSVRAEANEMLVKMADVLQQLVGDAAIVRYAHMELAEPTIAQGFAACVGAGATEVIAFPYMLSPGKHVTRDVPRLVGEAAREFPQVSFRVTEAFGVSEKLAELIAFRAGVEVATPQHDGVILTPSEARGRDRSPSRQLNNLAATAIPRPLRYAQGPQDDAP